MACHRFDIEENTACLCLWCVAKKQYLERMEGKKVQSKKASWEAVHWFARTVCKDNAEVMSEKDRNVGD